MYSGAMKLVFMGTGTSQGVPVIGYDHSGIDLSNPKNWRTRSSIHLYADGTEVQVDAGPEFRLQCLKNSVSRADVFILTHGHADHIAGMDDLRRFCDVAPDNTVDVYSNDYGIERIRAMFPYALGDRPTQRGYPCFNVRKMPETLGITENFKIRSTPLPHGNIETLGLSFECRGRKIVYYTDCKSLPPRAVELARGADILIIDCLRKNPHPSHMSFDEAMAAVDLLAPKTAYFTHLTSHIDYGKVEPTLPSDRHVAYDGLTVEL